MLAAVAVFPELAALTALATLTAWFPVPGVGTALAQPHWQTLPTAPVHANSRHDDVWFADDFTGWVVNGGGEIWHTSDGGDSWQLQFETGVYNRAVTFASAQRGWVGTLFAPERMYETNDGGAHWSPVHGLPAQMPAGICGMWAVSPQVVYAVGRYNSPAGALKTDDGGVTWSFMDVSAYAGTLVDCWFRSAQIGFVVGSVGPFPTACRAVVLQTMDGGRTWETRHTSSRTGEWCWKISFPSNLVGFVSVERASGPKRFLKTTDGGLAWVEMPCPNANEQGIGFVTEQLGWLGGSGNPTYRTVDGGIRWALNGFATELNRIRVLRPDLAYAVGRTVYRFGTPGATGAVQATPSAPPPVSLSSFPNPFDGVTSLQFEMREPAGVHLAVYDLRGRLVATLLEAWMAPGLQSVAWDSRGRDGARLAAGVYFCRLDAGERHETAKLQRVR